MAKKLFDRRAVLEQAMNLFWQAGYGACSIQQLSRATGLQAGSLYHEFGSKEMLFREAIECYALVSQQRIEETLSSADNVVEGIARLLNLVISQTKAGEYCSCFLIKTQLELSSLDPELSALATEKLQLNEAAYRKGLEQAFPPEEASLMAKQVMMAVFAIRVYGYQSNSQDVMFETVRSMIPWLPDNFGKAQSS
ncbi:TetR/AcrR family transcriptional regulator [Kiloniella sp. b19]|uniref:TetR/AcrR family transcriptional regulator n=1 Tax=Kiloniella sp. GXU_MW_B19 TaxID=3141326 RepID=UPI0031D48E71